MPVRVAVGDPRQITVEFPVAATGDVEVSIVSGRTGVVTGGPFLATQISGGKYGYTLPSTLVAAVDELTLTFVGIGASIERSLVEHVQVAGEYYFTTGEARSLGPIDPSYSDADIERLRMAVEDQIEMNCHGTSFVKRFVTEKFNGNTAENFVRLTKPYVQALYKVLQDGADVTASCTLDGRFVWRDSGWDYGHQNVEVKYEGGFQAYPPEDLRRKSIEATRYGLMRERRTGMPSNVISLGTEVGVARFALAGMKQPFGLPEVDAVVLKWMQAVGMPL